jgi:hypothetical protein
MTPDVERLITTYLPTVADVVAITATIGTRTPPTLDDPWVRITLLDDSPAPSSPALHLIAAMVQVDCYAGAEHDYGQAEASLLALTVRAALHAMPAAEHDGAVVTAVKFGGTRRLPDTDLQPARERYIFDGIVSCHARP